MSEQEVLIEIFDRHGQQCGNCGCVLIARGGTLGEHSGLSAVPEGSEDLSLCGYCMGLEYADLKLEVSGWIRVEDRMPEDRDDVIAYGKYYETDRPEVASAWFKGGLFIRNEDGDHLIDVTHWQPMPEPPAEVGK